MGNVFWVLELQFILLKLPSNMCVNRLVFFSFSQVTVRVNFFMSIDVHFFSCARFIEST